MSLTDTQFPPFQYVGSSDDEDYDPDHESDDPLTATRPLRKRPANRTAVPLVREHRPTDDSSSPEPLSYEIPRGRLLPCGKQGCQARLGSLELLKKHQQLVHNEAGPSKLATVRHATVPLATLPNLPKLPPHLPAYIIHTRSVHPARMQSPAVLKSGRDPQHSVFDPLFMELREADDGLTPGDRLPTFRPRPSMLLKRPKKDLSGGSKPLLLLSPQKRRPVVGDSDDPHSSQRTDVGSEAPTFRLDIRGARRLMGNLVGISPGRPNPRLATTTVQWSSYAVPAAVPDENTPAPSSTRATHSPTSMPDVDQPQARHVISALGSHTPKRSLVVPRVAPPDTTKARPPRAKVPPPHLHNQPPTIGFEALEKWYAGLKKATSSGIEVENPFQATVKRGRGRPPKKRKAKGGAARTDKRLRVE